MKTVCCVCKTLISETDDGNDIVSHGYCDACYDDALNSISPIRVTCPECKTRHNETAVTVFEIAEDIGGRDVLTFKCPTCKMIVCAYRVSG